MMDVSTKAVSFCYTFFLVKFNGTLKFAGTVQNRDFVFLLDLIKRDFIRC